MWASGILLWGVLKITSSGLCPPKHLWQQGVVTEWRATTESSLASCSPRGNKEPAELSLHYSAVLESSYQNRLPALAPCMSAFRRAAAHIQDLISWILMMWNLSLAWGDKIHYLGLWPNLVDAASQLRPEKAPPSPAPPAQPSTLRAVCQTQPLGAMGASLLDSHLSWLKKKLELWIIFYLPWYFTSVINYSHY